MNKRQKDEVIVLGTFIGVFVFLFIPMLFRYQHPIAVAVYMLTLVAGLFTHSYIQAEKRGYDTKTLDKQHVENARLRAACEVYEEAVVKFKSEPTYFRLKREVNGVKEYDGITVNELRHIAEEALARGRALKEGKAEMFARGGALKEGK